MNAIRSDETNLSPSGLCPVPIDSIHTCRLGPLSTEQRPLGYHCETKTWPDLSAVSNTPKKVVSVENTLEILEGPLRDTKLNFQQISWISTEIVKWLVSIRWETNTNHYSWQRPLRVHWVLIVRSLRDQLRSLRNQLRSLEMLRLLKYSWEIIERPVIDTVVRSLRGSWAFIESPLPSKTTVLNQFKVWWRPWGPLSSLKALKKHGRPWRSLNAHWMLKDHWEIGQIMWSLMVSQRSRLCGKGVLPGEMESQLRFTMSDFMQMSYESRSV